MVLPPLSSDGGHMETMIRPTQWKATGIRIVFGLVAAAASGYASLVMLFIGAIEYTGCFLECSTPNRPVGAVLLVGAAAAAVAAATYAFFDRRFRLSTTFLAFASGAGLLILGVAAG